MRCVYSRLYVYVVGSAKRCICGNAPRFPCSYIYYAIVRCTHGKFHTRVYALCRLLRVCQTSECAVGTVYMLLLCPTIGAWLPIHFNKACTPQSSHIAGFCTAIACNIYHMPCHAVPYVHMHVQYYTPCTQTHRHGAYSIHFTVRSKRVGKMNSGLVHGIPWSRMLVSSYKTCLIFVDRVFVVCFFFVFTYVFANVNGDVFKT